MRSHKTFFKRCEQKQLTFNLNVVKRDPLEYHNYLIEKAKDENLILKYKHHLYIGIISVGTPPQTLPVLFDTGSEFFYVTSRHCMSNNNCSKVDKIYNHKNSETFKAVGEVIQQAYPSGNLKAVLNKDSIYLNDKVLNNQVIGEIIESTGDIFEKEISAIAGLAYKRDDMRDEESLLENIVKNKILKRNVFAFNLMENEGQMTMGWIDKSAYKGKLNKHPLVQKHYWSIKLNDISVNGNKMKMCEKNKFCQVIVDTGTNDISLPKTYYNKLLDYIKVKEDCSNYHKLQPITFIIDNVKYPLEKEFYVHKFNNKGVARCSLNIVPIDLKNNVFLLGEPFIKKYYTVFDRDENAVWFGLKE